MFDKLHNRLKELYNTSLIEIENVHDYNREVTGIENELKERYNFDTSYSIVN